MEREALPEADSLSDKENEHPSSLLDVGESPQVPPLNTQDVQDLLAPPVSQARAPPGCPRGLPHTASIVHLCAGRGGGRGPDRGSRTRRGGAAGRGSPLLPPGPRGAAGGAAPLLGMKSKAPLCPFPPQRGEPRAPFPWPQSAELAAATQRILRETAERDRIGRGFAVEPKGFEEVLARIAERKQRAAARAPPRPEAAAAAERAALAQQLQQQLRDAAAREGDSDLDVASDDDEKEDRQQEQQEDVAGGEGGAAALDRLLSKAAGAAAKEEEEEGGGGEEEEEDPDFDEEEVGSPASRARSGPRPTGPPPKKKHPNYSNPGALF